MIGLHGIRTPIGVDVGSRIIKAVQLNVLRGRYRTAAISVVPRADAEKELSGQEIRELRLVLKRQGFQGRDIVLAAPDQSLLRGVFDLPRQVSGAPVAQIARMELSRMHQVQPDSFEMICWEPATMGQSQSTMQAIAVGCPHETANAFLDQFDENGFNVCALDVRSAAAARACAPLVLAPPAVTAILDLGWSATKLLIVCCGTVVYERLLANSCLSALVARLSEKFNVPGNSACQIVSTMGLSAGADAQGLDEQTVAIIRRMSRGHFDAVLEGLQAPFAYAGRQYPGEGVKRMVLIGGGASVAGVSKYLQECLKVEVATAAPSDILESASHLLAKADNPAVTVALGLAKFTGA
jgi:Tfp pilus assembly PilM family ATPase